MSTRPGGDSPRGNGGGRGPILDAIARLGRSMRKGFRGVNRRIDRLTSLTLLANQSRRKDHDRLEARVVRLEARVVRLEPRVDPLERRR